MFFWLSKPWVPLTAMTDRLQRFELKIFVCVLLKRQSHLHLGCPGGKQIIIKFSFLGELSPLRLWRMRNGLDIGSWLFGRKTRPPLRLSYTAFVLNPPEAARVQGWVDIKGPILSHEAQTIKHVMQCTVQFVWLCIAQARSSPWLLHIPLCHYY